MKGKKSFLYVSLLLLLLMGTLLWLQDKVTFLIRQYQTISGRLSEETFTIKELEQAGKEEKEKNENKFREIVLWKQGGIKELYNPTLKRSVKVPITLVYGSMETTTPMELECGSYVYKKDKIGCVIDTDTAYKLFQNTNVVGKVITCETKKFRIRGVVKTKNPVFLRQSTREEEETFDRLEFVFNKNPENGTQSAKLFLDRYGKGKNAVLIDGILYHTLIQRLGTTPYWVLSVCMLYYIWNWIKKEKKKRIWLIVPAFCILVGYTIGIYCYIGNPFYMPAELIPTKWSDFDFWTAKWKEIREHWKAIRYLVPNTKDVLLIGLLRGIR